MLSSGKRGSHCAQEKNEKAQSDTAEEAATELQQRQQLADLKLLAEETNRIVRDGQAAESLLAETDLQLRETVELQNRFGEQTQLALAVQAILSSTSAVVLTTTTTTNTIVTTTS
jgi:hypothetical protein